MVCGHIAEVLQAKFRVVWFVFFLGFIDLDAGLWRVLLTSADDVKLGGSALELRTRTENYLGKLEKWFGK